MTEDRKSKQAKSPDAPSFAPRRFSLFPKTLSDTLTQLVKPVYKKHGFAEHRVLTEWPAIVGEELAGCSLPQKLTSTRGKKEGGTLSVLVMPGRAVELQHMEPLILDRVATYFGYRAVVKLKWTQGSAELFRRKGAAKPAAPAAPQTPAALPHEVEDADLRRALEGLGQALAAVEK